MLNFTKGKNLIKMNFVNTKLIGSVKLNSSESKISEAFKLNLPNTKMMDMYKQNPCNISEISSKNLLKYIHHNPVIWGEYIHKYGNKSDLNHLHIYKIMELTKIPICYFVGQISMSVGLIAFIYTIVSPNVFSIMCACLIPVGYKSCIYAYDADYKLYSLEKCIDKIKQLQDAEFIDNMK